MSSKQSTPNLVKVQEELGHYMPKDLRAMNSTVSSAEAVAHVPTGNGTKTEVRRIESTLYDGWRLVLSHQCKKDIFLPSGDADSITTLKDGKSEVVAYTMLKKDWAFTNDPTKAYTNVTVDMVVRDRPSEDKNSFRHINSQGNLTASERSTYSLGSGGTTKPPTSADMFGDLEGLKLPKPATKYYHHVPEVCEQEWDGICLFADNHPQRSTAEGLKTKKDMTVTYWYPADKLIFLEKKDEEI